MTKQSEFTRARSESILSGPKAWVGGAAMIALAGLAVAFGVQGIVATPKINHRAAGGEVRRLSGDRLKLKDGRDVEFAAIRLPYDDEPNAEKSREVLNKWIEDEGVRLRFDESVVDEKGRIHAYIYANDTFINERLVRNGLAFVKLRAGERQFAEELLAAQREAQLNLLGIWRWVSPSAEGTIIGEPDRGTFHRPDCSKLVESGNERIEITGTAAAFDKGWAPCGKCKP